MPIQSLGIFDSVFDWVCSKIFEPIISWLSKILNSIFQWFVDNVVIPLLMPVFEFLWNVVIGNIADLFFRFIYNGFCQFLWLLDQLQNGFDVLIGLKDITYYSESLGENTQTTLLEYFMNNEIVRNAVLSITFIALGLSIIFAIYSVMRSTLDFDFEGKRPVGKVLNSVGKTMIAFLLVPTICIVGVSLVSVVLKQTCTAIAGGSDASLGRWILAISSMDAGRGLSIPPFSTGGQINEPWYSLLYNGTDYITFGLQIHVSHIDYFLGYASIIFMMIVMIACLFTFIKRIFDVIILYITSPYFVSTIVLDDGEKFKKWRESFIARILVGFGSVIGLRIFLMMVPVIMSDELQIFDSFAGNLTGGYIIRLVFILGGMFAVYKSSTLLTSIISSSVAAEENMNNALLGGMVAGGMMKGAKALAGAGISAFSKMSSKSKSKTSTSSISSKKDKSSKFTGGTNAFKAQDYSKNFKSDFAGSLGLKKDQINDDYIGKNVLDAEKAKEEGKNLNPLAKLDGLENFDFDDDYISDAVLMGKDGDFTGNADTTGIQHFGEKGNTPDIVDKFELSKDAIKMNGEQIADGAVNKTNDFNLSDDLFNNDYSSLLDDDADDNDDSEEGSAHFDGNMLDNVVDDNYKFHESAEVDSSVKFMDNVTDLSEQIKNRNYMPQTEIDAKHNAEEIQRRQEARAQRLQNKFSDNQTNADVVKPASTTSTSATTVQNTVSEKTKTVDPVSSVKKNDNKNDSGKF
ncbi:MAG: Mbov_0396 family ICE element transmembrane protein [Oscillospiraceae bacterium]